MSQSSITAVAATPAKGPAKPLHPVQRLAGKLVSKPAFWLTVALLGFALPLWGAVTRMNAPTLPVLGTLSGFTFKDQQNRDFGSANLQGRVWIANFIFTRCPTVCPRLTAKMGELQHRGRHLVPNLQLVSFSVDPLHDTPKELAAFATTNRVNPRMWSLLTGQEKALEKTIVEGLKISMGSAGNAEDLASVFHGTHFVLVDQALRIRGYYDSENPQLVDTLLHDAAMLINRPDVETVTASRATP